MAPTTLVGLVFVLAALSPGFVYLRVLGRFQQRDNRSAAAEVVEMATVGALTSTLAVALVFGLAELAPIFVPLHSVFNAPAVLRARSWSVVASAVTVLVISGALAAAGGLLVARLSRTKLSPLREGSLWSAMLARPRKDHKLFLAVETSDGRLVEGYYRAVSVREDDPARDALALRKPIAVTGPGGKSRKQTGSDLVLIPRSMIKIVHARYAPRHGGTAAGAGDHLTPAAERVSPMPPLAGS